MAAPDLDVVKLALRARALSALPGARAWENAAFKPVVGTPYVTEALAPAPPFRIGVSPQGVVETTGLYVLTWYAVAGTGTVAFSAALTTLLALFAPGTTVLAGSVGVRIRGNPAPSRSQITDVAPSWAVSVIRIPYLIWYQSP